MSLGARGDSVRKQLARAHLDGTATSRLTASYEGKPWCDAPVQVVASYRSSKYSPGMEVTRWGPCRKCDKCRTFRAMRWRDRIRNELLHAPRSWLVTLTFCPIHLAGLAARAPTLKGTSPEQRLERAAYQDVQRYLKRVRKNARAPLRYFAAFEEGKVHGRPHYHLLLHEVDKPISYRTITAAWRRGADSFVHAKLVASLGAASYVSKYITKSDGRARASARYGYVAARPSAKPMALARETLPSDSPNPPPSSVDAPPLDLPPLDTRGGEAAASLRNGQSGENVSWETQLSAIPLSHGRDQEEPPSSSLLPLIRERE